MSDQSGNQYGQQSQPQSGQPHEGQPQYGMPPVTPHQPAVAGPPPKQVDNAVKLMLARAALSVLSLLALFVTQDALRDQLREADPTISGSTLDTALTVALVAGAVFSLIFVTLYVLLALQVKKGKSWARIVTLVLAGLSILTGLFGLTQAAPALSRIIGIVILVVEIAIVVLLLSSQAKQYFAARS